jgi:hypothetical protein
VKGRVKLKVQSSKVQRCKGAKVKDRLMEKSLEYKEMKGRRKSKVEVLHFDSIGFVVT